MTNEQFIVALQKIGAVKFGSFTLKSGLVSPFYFDLRDMISFPEILGGVADLLVEKIKNMDFDVITGIPYTALPIASLVADKLKKPLVYMRKEEKAYGTGGNVIGKFEKGAKCLVIDDLITTGESKIETAQAYEKEGVVVKDFVVVIDRSADGTEYLKERGYELHSLMTLNDIVETLFNKNLLSAEKREEVFAFTESLKTPKTAFYEADTIENIFTKKLLNLMHQKKSNLVLSLDVESQADFFRILDETASEIVMLKTHVDILDDWDDNFVPKLQQYAQKYNFLIFEDRKFADIGNTVKKQFRSGVYKIEQWADVVTVHSIAGEGILKGLFDGTSGKSSFLLARMSAKGNLINETYTRKTFEIGKKFANVVSGYIGHGDTVEDMKRFRSKVPTNQLLLTPGVQLERGGDAAGQQYITVEEAIEGGADCIIVGRGIYGEKNPSAMAKIYRQKAWEAYSKK